MTQTKVVQLPLPSVPVFGQIMRFAVVGAVGYALNLLVFTAAIDLTRLPYLLAALLAFIAAVSANFTANLNWTFATSKSKITPQAARFLVVSAVSLAVNLALLQEFVPLFSSKTLAQACAVIAITPFSFLINRLWTFTSN